MYPEVSSSAKTEVDFPLPIAAPARKPRLLVVDDQPLHIQVLHRALSETYQMFLANSGGQALRICAEQMPDLILLDVVMPGMDGFEILNRLKSQPGTTDIPIIFVTAHGGEEIETQCLQAGGVDFIQKPVNPNVVKARVKTHLTLKFQSDFLRDMAFIDGLTGVSNRRHFDDRLAVEWGRAQRAEAALSLVLLDVDCFKSYNDHYGHQAGDDCLRQIAAVLKSEIRRPTDLVARYGGEEFVCLLPDTQFEDAMNIANRLAVAVKQKGIAHLHSLAAPVVTISLGVASREGAVLTRRAARLLALADKQLYQAKRTGRNKVCGEQFSVPDTGYMSTFT